MGKANSAESAGRPWGRGRGDPAGRLAGGQSSLGAPRGSLTARRPGARAVPPLQQVSSPLAGGQQPRPLLHSGRRG